MKKLYIGTNTKMTKTIQETKEFLSTLQTLTASLKDDITLFVIPSYTTLVEAKKTIVNDAILIGSQNMCWAERGQYTGEISPLMLKEIGIDIVMIGHSERRHVFLEDDNVEALKVSSAIEHGFIPLLCIGETKEEKDSGISNEILRKQLIVGFSKVNKNNVKNIIVAYEPVWAIGVNGEPASSSYVEAKHKVIKATLKEIFKDISINIPVLYGGSVNLENSKELIKQDSVDGLFVGRSAWDANNFNTLIRQVLPVWKEKGNKNG